MYTPHRVTRSSQGGASGMQRMIDVPDVAAMQVSTHVHGHVRVVRNRIVPCELMMDDE